jgi:hypothetical protein
MKFSILITLLAGIFCISFGILLMLTIPIITLGLFILIMGVGIMPLPFLLEYWSDNNPFSYLQEREKKNCPYCGASNSMNEAQCIRCKATFYPQPPNPLYPHVNMNIPTSWGIILLIVAIFVLVVGGLLILGSMIDFFKSSIAL